MRPFPSQPEPVQNLRVRAERALRQGADGHAADGDPTLRELRVQELELLMQNEALRELHVEVLLSRERYQDLFTQAPVAYVVLDKMSSVLDANAAASALLQLESDELVGRKLSTFVESKHSDKFIRHMRSALDGDAKQSVELSLIVADGSPRELRLESARNRLDPRQWRMALIDLTEVRRLERQLERSRRLEAIGTFAAGVAHDFSNLLAVVSAGSDLALELASMPELSEMPIQRVRRAAVQGRKMVRQLLRFASGAEGDSVGIFKLDAAVRAAESTLRNALGPLVELRIDLDAADADVCLDLGGPEEILLNLVANAQHAMPEGGQLVIETRTVDAQPELDRSVSRPFALLTVRDTGRGMDARTLSRAFEPFFSTKSPGGGTGLGLAMVHGIVKRAGGHIQLSSEPLKGTTLQIYLPLCDDRASERPYSDD